MAVDDTPIGTFVEIEGDATSIHGVAGALGFQPADFVAASYRTLFADRAGSAGQRPDMLFADADHR